MTTYKDVAQKALEEYADTVLTEGTGFGSTSKSIAAAAWDAMVDALAYAGADMAELEGFLSEEVEEYVEVSEPQAGADVIAARQALLTLAQALGVSL